MKSMIAGWSFAAALLLFSVSTAAAAAAAATDADADADYEADADAQQYDDTQSFLRALKKQKANFKYAPLFQETSSTTTTTTTKTPKVKKIKPPKKDKKIKPQKKVATASSKSSTVQTTNSPFVILAPTSLPRPTGGGGAIVTQAPQSRAIVTQAPQSRSGTRIPTSSPSVSPTASPSVSPSKDCKYLDINFDTDDNDDDTSSDYISSATYDGYDITITAVGEGGSGFTPNNKARFMDTLTPERRVVIIQESDDTTPSPNPQGGTITFDFGPGGADEVVSISLYRVSAEGSKVDVIGTKFEFTEFPVTNGDGDEIVTIPINLFDVQQINVRLAEGSVGVSLLEICHDGAGARSPTPQSSTRIPTASPSTTPSGTPTLLPLS
jgi:outer membrane biosynthesis protein TonB